MHFYTVKEIISSTSAESRKSLYSVELLMIRWGVGEVAELQTLTLIEHTLIVISMAEMTGGD